jgi:hypothetical protein
MGPPVVPPVELPAPEPVVVAVPEVPLPVVVPEAPPLVPAVVLAPALVPLVVPLVVLPAVLVPADVEVEVVPDVVWTPMRGLSVQAMEPAMSARTANVRARDTVSIPRLGTVMSDLCKSFAEPYKVLMF